MNIHQSYYYKKHQLNRVVSKNGVQDLLMNIIVTSGKCLLGIFVVGYLINSEIELSEEHFYRTGILSCAP